jgi:uncharacterized membrane protein
MHPLLQAALAGAATGCRSMTGLAALTLATPGRLDPTQPDRTLRKPWVKGLAGVAAAGELVTDKLPVTPPRTVPVQLIGRLVTGAGCGVIIARRAARSPSIAQTVLTAAVGTAAAALTTVAGPQWRRVAAERFGTDAVGAGLEDVTALTLGWAATR